MKMTVQLDYQAILANSTQPVHFAFQFALITSPQQQCVGDFGFPSGPYGVFAGAISAGNLSSSIGLPFER